MDCVEGLVMSSSHDFSVISWHLPSNLLAKSSAEFNHVRKSISYFMWTKRLWRMVILMPNTIVSLQMYSNGTVCHQSAIISMACNSTLVVTGTYVSIVAQVLLLLNTNLFGFLGDENGHVVIRAPVDRHEHLHV